MSDYELTDETVEVCGHILHRIRALRDINEKVHAGDLGGFVESTENLDASHGAWVFDDAWVSGSACVYDSARVSGKAKVGGDARVEGHAEVCGSATIHGTDHIGGTARIDGDVEVCEGES